MKILASVDRLSGRFKPCVDCGARVRVVCHHEHGLGRAWECDDCAMIPALCRNCALRGLVFAAVALAFLIGIAFGCVVYAGFCR